MNCSTVHDLLGQRAQLFNYTELPVQHQKSHHEMQRPVDMTSQHDTQHELVIYLIPQTNREHVAWHVA